MKKALIILPFILFLSGSLPAQEDVFVAHDGNIELKSDAPLEIIEFESNSLRGIIDPISNSFAFSVALTSFHGFNSEIQRTHFLENYMEQRRFPQATFTGKIIEEVPFETTGTYSVRAKGEFDIHGVKKERIIKATITIKEGVANIQTKFSVPVADHGIAIPKIVKQKIAEQIAISVDIDFVQGSKS